MTTSNHVLRRQLDRELYSLEDRYLALRDLKSAGALAGQPLPAILQFDKAVESLAAAMACIREIKQGLDQ